MLTEIEAERVVRALPDILGEIYPPPASVNSTLAADIFTGVGALLYLMSAGTPSEHSITAVVSILALLAAPLVAEEEVAWLERLRGLLQGAGDDPSTLRVLGSMAQVATGRDN